jgi:hypothetical protein
MMATEAYDRAPDDATITATLSKADWREIGEVLRGFVDVVHRMPPTLPGTRATGAIGRLAAQILDSRPAERS